MPANYTTTIVHTLKRQSNPLLMTYNISNGTTLILKWTVGEVMVNLIHMSCIDNVPGSHKTSMDAVQRSIP